MEIMILADRFCLPRLVTLCELYITKKVDSSIQKRVADGTSDVINLLLTSQVHVRPLVVVVKGKVCIYEPSGQSGCHLSPDSIA